MRGDWMMLLFLVCFLISAAIVNLAARIFMKIIGADMMFFKLKTRLLVIIVLAVVLKLRRI